MKELFIDNLSIFSKNMGKNNIFGEHLLKKYTKIGVSIFLKYSKIEVIYGVKFLVRSKSIPKSRIIPKSGFYCILKEPSHIEQKIHILIIDESKNICLHFTQVA